MEAKQNTSSPFAFRAGAAVAVTDAELAEKSIGIWQNLMPGPRLFALKATAPRNSFSFGLQ